MVVKTEFSEEAFAGILRGYDLGDLVEAQPIAEGAVQTNFLLLTSKGTYVFRHYENRSRESVLFESDLVTYLSDQNYPCPAPIKDRFGDIVGTFDGKPYVIFTWVEGNHVENPTDDQRRELIQMVARLHNLTRDYRSVNLEYRWNYDLRLCRQLASDRAEAIGTPNAREKLAWYLSELSQNDLPESLPRGICHGDFHFSNVLYQGDTFKALLDFDDANYTYLTFDLAALAELFASGFRWDNWSMFRRDDPVFDFAEMRATVAEYVKYRPLTEAEKWHLFDAYKLGVMLDCIWYFERGAAADFYERRKVDHLNQLGRWEFYRQVFEG